MRICSLFLLVGSATISSVSAFLPPSIHSPAVAHEPPRRSLTVVSSAKVLPIVYTGASVALFKKAIRRSSTKAEMAVLLTTSALSLLNMGPSDSANLASAKKAFKKTEPSSSGRAKQERQAALTWRKAVRLKIIGQIVGLALMIWARTTKGIMLGASVIMYGLVSHFLAGAGRSRHDEEGNWTPLPSNVATSILTMDALFCASAVVATNSPVASTKFAIAAGLYSFGAAVGALEGIPKFLKVLKNST